MSQPVSDGAGSRTVLVRMRDLLPELRPSEHRVAERFLADPAGTAALTVAELAARCATSTTTVVRFCRRMGYERYQDLRLDVTREITRERVETATAPQVMSDIDRDDTMEDIVAKVSHAKTLSIADTATALDLEALAQAVAAVCEARRVDVFGVGASAFVGLDVQQKLVRIGRTTLNWSDSHAAWTSAATLDRQCVAIAISHSGATSDTIEFLDIARGAGATTIALTNHGGSALAAVADIVLTTAARETAFRSGALGSRIAQLMVVDCLFIGVAQARYDESMAALRTTYSAVRRTRPAG